MSRIISGRGQIQSHVLVYFSILTFIVLIVILGFRSIVAVEEQSYQTSLVELKEEIGKDAELMSFKPGSIRQLNYDVPPVVKEVCFADLEADREGIGSVEINRFPRIREAVLGGSKKNLFVVSDSVDSFFIGDIMISNNALFTCFQAINRLNLWMKGTRDGTMIMKEFKTTKIVESGDTVLTSSDGAITLTIFAGSASPSLDVVYVEIIPPESGTEPDSEIYRFGPSGVTFNPPAQMTLKYYPEIVETSCPDELLYYHYDDNGVLVEILTSVSIDCSEQTATFLLSFF